MAFYRCMGGNGGGTTPTSITPSNSSPAAMSSGGVYQPTANGYAIESYDSKTPSDSTPPSVASGDIVKMGGAGYLYASQASTVKTGTTAATAQNTDIVIDTGLSTVSKFVWWAKRNGYNNIQIVNVDNSIFQDRYSSNLLGTSASGVNVAYGTATQNTVMVKSISGGVVTLHTYNSAQANVDAGVWYAE